MPVFSFLYGTTMKKFSLLLIACFAVMLMAGCAKKESVSSRTWSDVDPVVDEEVQQDNEDDETDEEADEKDEDEQIAVEDAQGSQADDDQYADEFDEEGNFDPKKFQDDEVDEIMKLFEELVSE